ncbi:protein-export chaperone SecB [Veillonella caviae]|uniref:protein-export chaperone SecB n=1 Tax=Veillonella caviae TaxID=248316 RepID=UPI0023564B1F|nr:protein-export chaperone SecB [Veillonella caviae]
MKKSRFQFSNPVLKQSAFEISEAFINSYSKDSSKKLTIPIDTEVQQGNIENNSCSIEIILSVGKRNQEDVPFFASVTMMADFKWDEDMSSDEIERFLSINAPAHLVSYARPIISFLTSMSPLPTYHMPFLNLNE